MKNIPLWSARTTVLMLAVVMLAGCAAARNSDRARILDETLKAYGSHVRWGHYEAATQFLDPDKRPKPRQLEFAINRLEQVRITGYRIVAQPMAAEPNSYIQVAELRLANRHTAVERSVADRQVWRWDEEAERWWLMTGLPDISRKN